MNQPEVFLKRDLVEFYEDFRQEINEMISTMKEQEEGRAKDVRRAQITEAIFVIDELRIRFNLKPVSDFEDWFEKTH